MIITGVVPLALWVYGPHWLRPYLIVVAAVLAIVIGVALWRRVTLDREDMANWPSRSDYRWQPGWSVERYHRALLTYLKTEDWRIRSALALDQNRLLLCLQRDRHRLPMLLLRPGCAPTEQDAADLHRVQRRDNVWEAVLVCDPPPEPEVQTDSEGATLILIGYDDLPLLPEALAGGADSDRHIRAQRDAQAAAEARAQADAGHPDMAVPTPDLSGEASGQPV